MTFARRGHVPGGRFSWRARLQAAAPARVPQAPHQNQRSTDSAAKLRPERLFSARINMFVK
jgi:hypothetical protein